MLVMRATKDPTHPIGELVSAQQPIGLDHPALAVGIHIDSIGFNHGLFLGRKHTTMRTPKPVSLSWRLWDAIQFLTNLLSCAS
jgi:hypothetical protein